MVRDLVTKGENMKLFQAKCPRCGEKHMEQATKCEYCGLIFSRLDKATNGAAKRAMKNGKADKVVYVKKTPKDVSKVKLWLLTIFLGLFGAEFFYVGRKIRGIVMFCCGLISMIFFGLSSNGIIVEQIESLYIGITGIIALMWVYDIFSLLIGTFKIPVYIDGESGVK